jgi:hypothetical protein
LNKKSLEGDIDTTPVFGQDNTVSCTVCQKDKAEKENKVV